MNRLSWAVGTPCSDAQRRGGPLAKFDLNMYARRGAELRIAELHQELESIYSAFPDLRAPRAGRRGRRPGRGVASTAAATAAAAPVAASARTARRKRSAMTAAQRRAVSLRMKKYWAERRKSKEK
jgi:hypothetical protein